MADLPGLVQRKVEAVGAVRGVGAEDGVEVLGLRGAEAVRGVGFVGVGLAVLASWVFGCGGGGDGCDGRFGG